MSETIKVIPQEGFCWARFDADGQHTRKYWRDGRQALAIIAHRNPVVEESWSISAAWILPEGSETGTVAWRRDSENDAIELLDAVAIGIHAALAATGVKLICLNETKAKG